MEYFYGELANTLIEGVTSICLKKPQDPIEYLARYLYHYRQQNQLERPYQNNQSNTRAVTINSNRKMDAEQMDYLDFDIPTGNKESSSTVVSMEMMMTANEKAAVHVHVDAIKINEDLFDDDDLS